MLPWRELSGWVHTQVTPDASSCSGTELSCRDLVLVQGTIKNLNKNLKGMNKVKIEDEGSTTKGGLQ